MEARCDGCNRPIDDTERFVEAACEYKFCSECVLTTTLIELSVRNAHNQLKFALA